MSDPYLSLVTVKNQLGVDIKRNEATRKIIERVTELGLNTAQYKNNQELLLLICNLAEYLVQNKKLSKKEIVMDVLGVVFSLQPAERQAYEANIEFLHQSNMITKVSRWKLFCTGVKELFFKKK
jgi:hypothetical protein